MLRDRVSFCVFEAGEGGGGGEGRIDIISPVSSRLVPCHLSSGGVVSLLMCMPSAVEEKYVGEGVGVGREKRRCSAPE